MCFCSCQICSLIISHSDMMPSGYSPPCPVISYLFLNTVGHLSSIHICLLCPCLSVLSSDSLDLVGFSFWETISLWGLDWSQNWYNPPVSNSQGWNNRYVPPFLDRFFSWWIKKKSSESIIRDFQLGNFKDRYKLFSVLPQHVQDLRKTAHPFNKKLAVQLKSLRFSWIH